MAGIGVNLPYTILQDGQDVQRFDISSLTESAQSGMQLRRQRGGVERAISGVASTAEVDAIAQTVTPFQFSWLSDRIGRPVRLRTPSGFSALVAIMSVRRQIISHWSDQNAWNVQLKFYVISRD